MYETILIPTDGSGAAACAAEHALSLASQYGSTVHVLYVVEPAGVRTIAGDREVARTVAVENGQAVVAALASGADDAVPVETAVSLGHPAEQIRRYAREVGPDLVVVGAHGVRRHDPLGPVARELARTRTWPLLVCPE